MQSCRRAADTREAICDGHHQGRVSTSDISICMRRAPPPDEASEGDHPAR
jgi:hypothetical protein